MKPIKLKWSQGEHEFALNLSELRALEDAVDAGFCAIHQRFEYAVWSTNDVIETLRLALIGGGMEAAEAMKIVQRAVTEQPILEPATVAQKVMRVCMTGSLTLPDDEAA